MISLFFDNLLITFKDNILIDIKIINVYKIQFSNQKSVSLRYVFESKENITIDQMNDVMNKIINAFEEKPMKKSEMENKLLII